MVRRNLFTHNMHSIARPCARCKLCITSENIFTKVRLATASIKKCQDSRRKLATEISVVRAAQNCGGSHT